MFTSNDNDDNKTESSSPGENGLARHCGKKGNIWNGQLKNLEDQSGRGGN